MKKCYICGRAKPDSKDHVPPKNLFLPEDRVNLNTVFAHKRCNEEYSKDDEYFRWFVLLSAYWVSEKGRRLWHERFIHGVRKPAQSKFRKHLIDSLHPVEMIDDRGIPTRSNIEASFVDASRVKRVLQRITAGLFYKDFGAAFPRIDHADVEVVKPETGDLLMVEGSDKGDCRQIGNGVFKYWWINRADTPEGLVFTFYDAIGCIAKFNNKDK